MTEAANIAADLRKSGQPMVLTRTTSGAYDPIAGVTSAAVVQIWTVYGRDNPIGRNTTTIDGTSILTGDRMLIVSADQVIAEYGDSVSFDNETYSVVARSKIKGVGAEVVLQKLLVRK